MSEIDNLLVNQIAAMLNLPLLYTIPDEQKQNLRQQIKTFIQEQTSRTDHIDKMLDVVFDDEFDIDEGLPALKYIKSIDVIIDSRFYDKLNEDFISSDSFDFEDYDDKFETPLNEYTLLDFITIKCYSFVDELADLFDQYPNESLQYIFEKPKDWFLDFYNEHIPQKQPINKLNNVAKAWIFISIVVPAVNNFEKIVFKIEHNSPEFNQEILNNSYDVIMEQLPSIANGAELKNIQNLISQEKLNHNSLFIDRKRLAKLKTDTHYMGFLYNCSVARVADDTNRFIFREFVESLINGYKLYIDNCSINAHDKKAILRELKDDLTILNKYNAHGENNQNIKEINEKITSLAIKNSLMKLIPYKVLGSNISINKNQLANYIKANISINKNSLIDNLDKIQVKSTDEINLTLHHIGINSIIGTE